MPASRAPVLLAAGQQSACVDCSVSSVHALAPPHTQHCSPELIEVHTAVVVLVEQADHLQAQESAQRSQPAWLPASITFFASSSDTAMNAFPDTCSCSQAASAEEC